jgi:hypothetical protein
VQPHPHRLAHDSCVVFLLVQPWWEAASACYGTRCLQPICTPTGGPLPARRDRKVSRC